MNTQNSKEHTPAGEDQNGNETIKKATKGAKTIIRKNSLYSDTAIAIAKRMRGAD